MSLLVAGAAAFVIILMEKTGIRPWVIAHAPRLLSRLFGCDFCLGFWLSFIMSVAIAIIGRNGIFVIVPVVSAPIVRLML